MKYKYIYIFSLLIIIVIMFRINILNGINNLKKYFFVKDDNLEINILKERINELEIEYQNLIDFKSNINIESNYIITNLYKPNYGFEDFYIFGNNYSLNDEVINGNGLIGIITKVNEKYSLVTPLNKTNILVKINDEVGMIYNYDDNGNIIINNISNYNNININDLVYSINDTYIGKVIKIINNDFDNQIVVSFNLNNLEYVAVIGKNI